MSNTVINPYNFAVAEVGSWKELDRTTLGSGNSTINVSGLADKRYYMILSYTLANNSNNVRCRLNADTAANYANRWTSNGAADSTEVNKNWQHYDPNVIGKINGFTVGYLSNLSTLEKLDMFNSAGQMAAGAVSAPSRSEAVNKWANTSAAFDEIDVINEGGTFGTGSEVVVLGYDPTDTHTTADNFWQELASVELGGTADELSSGTITAKKYLWVQYYVIKSGTANTRWRFNNDTGSNYSARYSGNGGADGTVTSQTSIYTHANTSDNAFGNIFIINNSANEKLGMFHETTTSSDRSEITAKWANTSSQITEIDLINTDTGDFLTGTLMRVWGHD
jgi:hypothetical protein